MEYRLSKFKPSLFQLLEKQTKKKTPQRAHI